MINEIRQRWENPPEKAKAKTRWWWYGCAVTRKEIIRQLEEMKRAGLGGVEIQILYPVVADDKEKGIYNIPYFSPVFFEVLKETQKKTEELHMTMDFTPGSSWPFGGPFIPKEYTPEEATVVQIDVYGPCTFSYDFTNRINGKIEAIVMGRMEQGVMVSDSVVDLKEHLGEKLLYGWHWGEILKEVEIPAGLHKIVAIVVENYRQLLGIPSRDAGGYAMDHTRKEVTDFFFQNGVKPIVESLGAGKIHAFFCDSIELAGNNWSPILLQEFQKRRGYDLSLWSYALWGEVGSVTEDIRYDYYRTMSELTIENFFEEMTACCHSLGSKSRIQAHGTWADILKAYGSADIPEGESFGAQDCYQVNSIHRRFAASAAHIYGKRIVSNESFTWLRMPRFLETLENMKAAADAIFLDGINLIVNHGYAYAPQEEKGGWPFYASSNLNDHEYYWKFFGELGKYLQRISALMQWGRHCCEVGVYLPQSDVWAENPLANLHMGMKLQEYIGEETADRIQRMGYYFDYLNDEAFTRLGIFEHGLRICENTYYVVILPWCKRLPLETAIALERFVESGGILVAAGSIPKKSCGLLERKNDGKIADIMERLFPKEEGKFRETGEGKAAWISDVDENFTALLKKQWIPDVRIAIGADRTGYIHRTENDIDLYFLAHIWEKEEEVEVIFRREMEGMEIWDALTGKEIDLTDYWYGDHEVHLKFVAEPFQSFLIQFGKNCNSFSIRRPGCVKKIRQELIGKWELSIPEKEFYRVLGSPVFWNKYEELHYYSGKGYYRFRWNCSMDEIELRNWEIWLHFENLHEIGEIYLNGKLCGVIWKRPYCICLDGKIRKGENQLEVLVHNRTINEARNPDHHCFQYPGTVLKEWPYFTEVINQIRRKRIDCYKEKEMVTEPVDSGIQGNVYLIYTTRKK